MDAAAPAANTGGKMKSLEVDAPVQAPAQAAPGARPGAASAATPGLGDVDVQRAELLDKVAPSSSSLSNLSKIESSQASGTAALGAPPAPAAEPVERQPWGSKAFWRMLMRFVGPGFLVAMAYIDPGNLAADMNQALAAGYSLAWVTLWCTVIGFVVQMLAAKLGVATGRHLAEHCRAHYPLVPRLMLWIAAELAIVACDMVEVIGGAAALNTLSSGAIPLWAGVLVTAAAAFGTLCLEMCGMRVLEAVLLTLIVVMGGTFGFMFFSTGVDYGQVAKGLAVPMLNANTIPYAVGSIGAIIMPHNLYLHSALVLSRADLVHRTSVPEAMRYVRFESGFALTLALVINIFIIAVFAHAFFGVLPEDGVGLGNAGALLADKYGAAMRYIWGVGLLAAACASTVTSTYAGQVVMTGFLRVRVSVFWRTALVRLSTLGPTLLVAVMLGNTDSTFSGLTEWLNIVQSLVLPFVVVPLVMLTSSGSVMGPHVNRRWAVAVLALIAAFLVGMNGYLAVTFALDQLPATAWARTLFFIGVALYCAFLGYLLAGPARAGRWAASAKAGALKLRASMPAGRAVDMLDGM